MTKTLEEELNQTEASRDGGGAAQSRSRRKPRGAGVGVTGQYMKARFFVQHICGTF